MVVVGMEVVRVVGERRDLEAVALEGGSDVVRIEGIDVDVRDAGVAAALTAGGRPACDLERIEAVRRGPLRKLRERERREGGGEESELQAGTATQRRSRELRSTASPITFSRCPSANVGKAAVSGIPPSAIAA
jgi:hypothetical protein